ncbi:MAG: beta-lactamase regulating signal transducer with metallopeptidase domain [Verrucomicrobiales bacterium]|jgi:beta-lactamase regulating signal transducer with metallopeptidase domain
MFARLIDRWSEDLAWVWISAVPRQAALILGVALLLRCFPRMAAAWRHWVWLVAALAIGLIPLAAVLLPQWPLIPAEWVYGADAEVVKQATAVTTGSVAEVVSHHQVPLTFGWLEACLVVWLGGVVMLVARLGAGLMGLRSFQRDREPVYKGRLCARLEHCRHLANVTTLVDLYQSKRSTLPMTWGVLRPAINVPYEADDWDDERLDAVFLHELAHIQRADCWSNMVLKVVCALNWFNPFMWMAARRTYLAQEVACDDFACARLRPSDYARHLLELTAVVADFHRSEIEPAVGFYSCDHLRVRVSAALDPKRSRESLPSRIASLMSSVVFLFMVVMAMVSLRFVDESRAAVHAFNAPPVVEEEVSLDAFAFAHEMAALALSLIELSPVEPVAPEESPVVSYPMWGEFELSSTMVLNEDSLFMDEPSLPQEEEEAAARSVWLLSTDPAPAARPLIMPAKVVVSSLLVPPKVTFGVNRFDESQVDWRGFHRQNGERRGHTIVLDREESVCYRYARMSPFDRKKQGGFRRYLRRNGLYLNDDEIRDLIRRASRGRS